MALVRGAGQNAWNIDAELTYRDWCAERGLPTYVDTAEERDGEAGGRLAAERLLAAHSGPMPLAVLCLTGRHAAGLLAGIQAVGLRVPTDVMIAAASDSEHTRSSRPAITAFELSSQATSAALLDLLQARMDGRISIGPILTSARFHPRRSTNPRASSSRHD